MFRFGLFAFYILAAVRRIIIFLLLFGDNAKSDQRGKLD